MAETDLLLGASSRPEMLALRFANRHGLITGATGTGKTVTLQILAEGFSRAGVPVFCADVKGDVAGLSVPGTPKDFLLERAGQVGLEDYGFKGYPTLLWDLYGRQGHPVRASISEMGPVLLARMLELNATQEGVLTIAFRLADEEGLLLVDAKDLQALLAHMGERARELSLRYGNVSTASIGAIQRALLVLDQQGGGLFLGERALEIEDLMRLAPDGRGYISILAADELMRAPRLYSVFLLWLLSELFEALPEIGNPDKPRLVFFFDEAHLLFTDAPKALLDKVEQLVKLVRSKGVGVYFVTQNPMDIPEPVLAQLGNRIQHALRAYTPREQRAVRAAAGSFRANPEFSTEEAITTLAVGEALVSTLEGNGVPSIVGRTLIRPPTSRMGPLSFEERAGVLAASPVRGQYDAPIDRESAYEVLKARAAHHQAQAESARGAETRAPQRRSTRQTPAEAAINTFARTMARQLGNSLARGILGGLSRKR